MWVTVNCKLPGPLCHALSEEAQGSLDRLAHDRLADKLSQLRFNMACRVTCRKVMMLLLPLPSHVVLCCAGLLCGQWHDSTCNKCTNAKKQGCWYDARHVRSINRGKTLECTADYTLAMPMQQVTLNCPRYLNNAMLWIYLDGTGAISRMLCGLDAGSRVSSSGSCEQRDPNGVYSRSILQIGCFRSCTSPSALALE